jgi:YggT family protein
MLILNSPGQRFFAASVRLLSARPQREKGAALLPCCACGNAALPLGSRAPFAPDGRMHAVIDLILLVIRIYIWLLIAQAILSWLLAFGVINRYNRGVAVIGDFLYRVTEPALRPIRSFLPNFGGIDISPVILILILMFLRRLLIYDLAPSLL